MNIWLFIYVLGALISWMACGVFACGFVSAYFQKSYPSIFYARDRILIYIPAISGPIAILAAMIFVGIRYLDTRQFHGWKF